MRKSRFTQEQIAFALKQAEGGAPVGEVCRKMGISENTFYRWKRKFDGLGVAEIRRLRQLEEENRELRDRLNANGKESKDEDEGDGEQGEESKILQLFESPLASDRFSDFFHKLLRSSRSTGDGADGGETAPSDRAGCASPSGKEAEP